ETGRLQSDFLRDHSADREAKYVNLLQAQRLDEGDGVSAHPLERRRDLAGTAGDARVVEQDHLTVASEAIRHRRIPIIHGADVVLVEDDRHTAGLAESAIGEADSVSLYELCRRGLVSMNHYGRFLYHLVGTASDTRARAAFAQSMSFCTVGAPLSPIAPTTSPFTLMGNPPPHAATRASVGMPAKSDGSLWIKLKKSCVETPNRAVYALFCAISMVGIEAPSIRLKALRLPPSSRIATFSLTPSSLAFAAAASTIFCASSEEMLYFFTTLAIGLTPHLICFVWTSRVQKQSRVFNEELRVLVVRAVIGVGVDDHLRVRDVLLHDERVHRGHDHVVTAVHDECWLLDRLQVFVGPLLLDARLLHRFDLGGRHLVVHFGIAPNLTKVSALQKLPSRRLAYRGRTEFDREPDMLGRIIGGAKEPPCSLGQRLHSLTAARTG